MEQVINSEGLFDDLHKQMQSYEIVSAEDRRTRYLFFAGDVGDVPGVGGMRIDSPCIPRKTLYRCMFTPVVTVRKMELTNLIPDGARVPGSEDRIKHGCSEYWLNAGPEAGALLGAYGNGMDVSRNWGLVEVQPELLRGMDWDKEVKQLKIQMAFFPEWPKIPNSNFEVQQHLEARIEFIKTTRDPLISVNRDLYLAIGADMLRAVDAAQRHQESICNGSNQAVTQPRGDESYKYRFDERDEISFRRSGMIKNTEALRKVAEQMKNGASSGLDAESLKQILSSVVPSQQPAFNADQLAMAIVQAAQLLNQAVATSEEDKKAKNAKPERKPNDNSLTA